MCNSNDISISYFPVIWLPVAVGSVIYDAEHLVASGERAVFR